MSAVISRIPLACSTRRPGASPSACATIPSLTTLVAEEHELRGREQSDAKNAELLEADQQRLRAAEIELDRCWDLLRQRRALRDAGNNPDEAHVRDANTVDRYLQ